MVIKYFLLFLFGWNSLCFAIVPGGLKKKCSNKKKEQLCFMWRIKKELEKAKKAMQELESERQEIAIIFDRCQRELNELQKEMSSAGECGNQDKQKKQA